MVSINLIGIIILLVIFTLTIIIQYHFSKRELFTNKTNKSNKSNNDDDDNDKPNLTFNSHETACIHCCKMSENKDPKKCRENCIVNGTKCLCC